MKITLDRSTGIPVYQQIVDQIRSQILSGELAAGFRLPPERQLSEALSVNRTTVLNAYRELKAEGLIDSHVGRGTEVLPLKEESAPVTQAVREPIWEHLFSSYSSRFSGDIVNDILKIANRKDVISFAAGIAALDTRPAELLGIIGKALEEDGRALMVSPVEGFYSLREAVRDFMVKRGCFCKPEEVILLSGSQQGIDLCARVLLEPDDIVIVEDPTFFPAIQAFRAAGARLMGVPITEQGMDLDVLEQLLQRYRPKLIYTIPNYHNPCGVTMPLDNRIRLLDLAYKFRTLILEDDPYGELCYDGNPMPTLKSMDRANFVIYLNTFSKTVYPGLRLGWAVAHRKLVARFASVRQLVDLHSNCLSQQAIERFLRSGQMESHLSRICGQYSARRDSMLHALERYAPAGLSYTRPLGGYYIWCTLPPGVSAAVLSERLAERGVAVLPGNPFYLSPMQGDGYVRLNYTYPPYEDIDRGVRLMCDTIRELMIEDQEAPPAESILNPIV